MKLIIAIVSNKDTQKAIDNLSAAGYYVTKFSTSGAFLADGHTSLMVGTENDKVDGVLEALKCSVTKRTIKEYGVQSTLTGTLLKQPVDVEQGGGVAFVIDVEDFVKF